MTPPSSRKCEDKTILDFFDMVIARMFTSQKWIYVVWLTMVSIYKNFQMCIISDSRFFYRYEMNPIELGIQ